jgi:hypothetical protein
MAFLAIHGRQSASKNAPAPGSGPPFSGRRLLVRADDGAVDHQILVVAIGRQRVEHPLPYAGMAPAAEAPVHGLPASVALRQVAPASVSRRMIRYPEDRRSGDRRGRAPDRSTHQHPFTNRRLSDPVRPGSPALPGSSGATRAHRAPHNSYRLTANHLLHASAQSPMNQRAARLGILNVDPA